MPGNVSRFKAKLANVGLTTEDGTVEYIDLVKECCQGHVEDTLANNPWPNAYMTIKFPANEGAPYPGWIWQLREDEAIVVVGRTPPEAAYFSYQTFLTALPDAPGIRLGIAVGDTTNIATVRTTSGRGRRRTPASASTPTRTSGSASGRC